MTGYDWIRRLVDHILNYYEVNLKFKSNIFSLGISVRRDDV